MGVSQLVRRIQRILWGDELSDNPDRSVLLVLWMTSALGLLLLFRVNVLHDAFQYYAYARSLCFDGDLNLFNEIHPSNSYRFYNPFPEQSGRFAGTWMLELPFILPGHLLALLLNRLGWSYALNGYSMPYVFFVGFASYLAGLVGMALSYRVVRKWFSSHVALAAVLLAWWATPAVFFHYAWTGWSHPFALALMAAFLLQWQRTREQRTAADWGFWGFLGGWLLLVQPAAALVFLMPALEGLVLCLRREWRELRAFLRGTALFVAVALLMFSPQFSLWKVISGNWIASPYAEVGDEHDWLHPAILPFLFSVRQHGAFAWCPWVMVALLSLILLLRRDKSAAWAFIGITVATLYYYSTWSIWWSGVGYSNRFLVHLTPVIALGSAAALSFTSNRRIRWAIAALGICLVILNLVLMGAYLGFQVPMGIADPWRVRDPSLPWLDWFGSGVKGMVTNLGALVGGSWINENFFLNRLLTAGRLLTWSDVVLHLALLLLTLWATARVLKAALCVGARRAMAIVGAGGLVLVVVTHGMIWRAQAATNPFPGWYHFDEIDIEVRQPAEPSLFYSSYPRPVRAVDIVNALIYGHAIPQGAPVADVVIVGQDGTEVRHTLRAGEDTAEASYPRPEYRQGIRHGCEGLEVVRSFPTHLYSRSFYEGWAYRTTLELPQAMEVRRIEFHYHGRAGRLIVYDVFLRE